MHKRPDRIAARRRRGRRPIVSERVFILRRLRADRCKSGLPPGDHISFLLLFSIFLSAVLPPHPAPTASRRIISPRVYTIIFFSRFRKTVVYCLNQFYRRGGRLLRSGCIYVCMYTGTI